MGFIDRVMALDDALKCVYRRPETDCYLITLQQSGTHWAKMVLSNYFCEKHDCNYGFNTVNVNDIIPHAKDKIIKNIRRAPRIRQAHHSYWPIFRNQKVVLLIRSIKNTLMSAYDKIEKTNDKMISFEEFIKGDFRDKDYKYTTAPLSRRVQFMNKWGCNLHKCKSSIVFKYERLKTRPYNEYLRMVSFIDDSCEKNILKESVDRCSKQRMLKLSSKSSGSHKHAVSDTEGRNEEDYFNSETRSWFNRYLDEHLSHDFGYDYSQ